MNTCAWLHPRSDLSATSVGKSTDGKEMTSTTSFTQSAVVCSPYSSLHLLQKHIGEVELESSSFEFPVTALTWLGLIWLMKSKYFDV